MTELSRRDFLKFLSLGTAGAVGAVALAGCATEDQPVNEDVVTEEPKVDLGGSVTFEENDVTTSGDLGGNVTRGKDAEQRTLIASASKTFETMDPFYATGQMAQRMWAMCLDPLWDFAYATSDELGVGVKEWSYEEDDTVVVFELHDNIYDYEGNHYTADDLMWYYEYYTGVVGKNITNVISIEKTGTYTGKVKMKNKHYAGNLPTLWMFTQAAYEAAGDEGFRTNIVGTGLYKCSDFVSGSSALFEQTYTYWGDTEKIRELLPHKAANYDFVRYDVITEETQIANALRINTIQVYDIQVSTAEDFVADPGNLVVHRYPAMYPSYLEFNMYPGSIFADNKALREAIAYGINWDDVAYAATMGYGNATGVIGYSGIAGYNPEWETDGSAYYYDKELAAQKLEDAGYKPGELTIKFTYNKTPNDFAVMQANLADIGIDLQMDLLDEVTYMAKRGQANTLEWDILGFDTMAKGFVMNILYTFTDNTNYEWGQMNGANDQEMHDLGVAARYGTQEDIDRCYHAMMDRVWYLPRFNDISFIASYNKVEQIIVNNSQQLMAQACLATDDYDVFY